MSAAFVDTASLEAGTNRFLAVGNTVAATRWSASSSPHHAALAVAAFGILLLRYTQETSFSLELRVDGGAPRALELAVSDDTRIDALCAAVLRSIGAGKSNDPVAREITITWSEAPSLGQQAAHDGARLALCVRLPELSLDVARCAHRGLLTAPRPLVSIERHWRSALWALDGCGASRVSDVDVIGGPERRLLMDVWSRTRLDPDLARPDLLHRVFERSARARPDHVAVHCNGAELTYRELDARAERLARGLRARGIGPGAFVAFQLPRSIDVYVALLGVLKSGAAYVPLDPEVPPDRVLYVAADGAVSALLTVSSFADGLAGIGCPVVFLDQDWRAVLPDAGAMPSVRPPVPEDVCYVIYTSGSTGKPKGVAVEHRSAVNLVRVEQELYGIDARDRVFQGFSVAFDAAVEEVWMAFAAGATLVVGTKEIILSDLAHHLTQLGVTVFSTVPTLLSTLDRDLPTVRVLILGGEACPQILADRWSTAARALFNTYGPTEATVIATAAQLAPREAVTIGRPITNYFVYILDPAGRLVPAGAAGELCIGGVGVARGYVGKPELTAARFVPNPYAGRRDAPPTLYRTGDRARFDATGNIEFLGRLDDQVKLRGFRIELGEVEAALLACGGIAQAVAMVHADPSSGPQLVAYVVRREGSGPAPNEPALKDELRKHLAPYMVPSRVIVVDSLPTLTSGKVDKKSLPPPAPVQAAVAAPLVSPASGAEEKIARCWASLFGAAAISRDADFFMTLGGHSLLAAQMVSRLRQDPAFSALSVLDVYRHTTVAALARHCESTMGATAPPATQLSPVAPEQAPQAGIAAQLRYRACALVQLAGLYVTFGIYGVQLEAPYLTFGWLRHADATFAASVLATMIVAISMPPVMLLVGLAAKWIVIGRYRAGRYPLWGAYYVRWWFVDRLFSIVPTSFLAGTPLLNAYYRLLGATIGQGVWIGSDSLGAFDLLSLGSGSTVGVDANLSGHVIEDGSLVLGPITIGKNCLVGARSVLTDDVVMEDRSSVGELSMVARGTTVFAGEHWAGSPARCTGRGDLTAPIARPGAGKHAFFTGLYALSVLLFPVVPVVAILPGLVLLNHLYRTWDGEYAYLLLAPAVAATFVVILCLEIAAAKWVLLGRVRPGRYEVYSKFYFCKWVFDQLMGLSLNLSGALYATSFLTWWYRLLGMDLGARCEFSTATGFLPDLLHIGDGAFIADCVSIGAPHVDRGYVYAAHTRIGERSFVGNSAVVPAGAVVGQDCLIGCLSASPADPEVSTRDRSSWFGSPAIALPRREARDSVPDELTYRPSIRLTLQRAGFELLRIVLPTAAFIISTCLVITTTIRLHDRLTLLGVLGLFPFLYAGLGALGAVAVVALKWLVIGRYRPGEAPLWSSFVWRTELITGLHENLANPFFVERLVGTPFCAWFFRALGMKIGKRVFMATTEFTEYDLLTIGDDVCLNNDCTLQTHLFEDRVMKMSTIHVGAGCTVGEDAIVLYDTKMEAGSSLGALSLLMKGETLPRESRWEGAPAAVARRPDPRPVSPSDRRNPQSLKESYSS